MNEMTAAVGFGQLERFPGYLDEYNAVLDITNEAIADCKWLVNRTVSKSAQQSGYNWACLWEGDKYGLKLDKFKKLCAEEDLWMGFHFTERPATTFDVFRKSTAYHKNACPVRCPLYKGDYDIRKAKLPVTADILKRVISTGCVEVGITTAKKRAKTIKRIIAKMEG